MFGGGVWKWTDFVNILHSPLNSSQRFYASLKPEETHHWFSHNRQLTIRHVGYNRTVRVQVRPEQNSVPARVDSNIIRPISEPLAHL